MALEDVKGDFMSKNWILSFIFFGLMGLTTQCMAKAQKLEKEPASKAQKTDVLEKATFAGGCFWCMEPPFEKLNGVQSVVSGFMGGQKAQPSYKEVSSGSTGHKEVVQITFNPKQIRYEDLLEVFWRNVDPTDEGGQFVDRGDQYATAIFYHDVMQKKTAEESKQKMEKSGRFKKPIVTPIQQAGTFYPAEDYHQDYY